MHSIKAKLIFLYSIIMLSVLSILSVILFVSLKRIVYKPIDSNLLVKAKSIDYLIKNNSFRFSFSDINGNHYSFSFSDNRLWVYSSKYSKYFFQIRTLNGDTLEKSISLGALSLPFSKKFKKFEDIRFKGKILRLLNYVDKKDKMIIQVAYDTKRENNILNNFTIIMLVSILTIMITSALGGFIVSNKALKPIEYISKQISKISKENLDEKIDIKNVPSELEILVSSFNDMLKRLNKAFKQQKRFISDISHELKTPVSVIMMQAEIVLKRERDIEEYKKAMKSIKEKTQIMSELIEKMLLLATLESKYNRMSFGLIKIGNVIEEAVSLFQHKAREKKIEIVFDKKDDINLKADKITLLEVFINLIDNAVKYNKQGGSIEISLEQKNSFVFIGIKDTGLGIPKDKLNRITEEFYRVDESRSKDSTGFGLGLSIVKRIIELHKGSLEIESKEGEFTYVKIYIPLF